jgi:hypothetical protein
MIPSLVSVTFAVLIAAIQGLMTANTLAAVAVIYMTVILLYIAIYHINIIAVMLTGHVMITIFSAVILQTYEVGVTGILAGLNADYPEFSLFTPYRWCIEAINASGIAAELLPVLWMLIQGAAFLGLAYLLFRARPAEAAGRALAFEIMRPIAKIALVVPAALFNALIFREMTYYSGDYLGRGNPWFIGLAIIITAALYCGLLEVIYEFDIKAAGKNKRYILICGALAALIFLIGT